jgi:hypothetical protein
LPAIKAGHVEVVLDEAAFDEDLQRANTVGREVALRARDIYARDGAPVKQLLACDVEAPDATSLPGCVKVYLPSPRGRFGMVFAIERRRRRLVLAYLAFGIRHQPLASHAPTVYQLAHGRLHA